jgi:regulator of replication initiation timing
MSNMVALTFELYEENIALQKENEKLRAAIERVRALHAADGRNECPQCLEWHWVDWENAQSPCPTIRAVDGDDA